MAQMIDVECGACEGTGQQLNTFDLPVLSDPMKPQMVKMQPRSRSGREVLGAECPICRGYGIVTVLSS